MSNPPLAITGSTGLLGAQVASLLSAAGAQLRLLARTPDRAPRLPGSAAVACSYDDTAAAASALEGIDVLFMVSASESADRLAQHFAFVDAARDAGVQHIVYTSFQNAAPDATFTLARDQYATEERIKASGMRWTMLRDSLYLDFLPALVGDDGVIRGPAGDGRVAAVTRADIARTAARVLLDPAAHAGRTYTLTGSEALTLDEVAAILTRDTGRTVRFHDETLDEAYASRAKWNAPDWQNDAWVSTYTAIAAGELAEVTTDVLDITGTPPLTLVDYLAGTRQTS
ncbi:SDR family oxidoreductase [Microbacterium rhizomatis]|uniref:SDR family oxidoreductase n=1 Tax=Microbacterium rhizomatis TaxID=1631477 RepID=A0A5J5J5U5_9MICO|nr:SDR family oxidoreductase [Microbacterium rhizomatis]KAA9111432.1 SDR family oxidoreductase [Microbacterium rhizomatis]